jgi:cytoskeletal protein RodZ
MSLEALAGVTKIPKRSLEFLEEDRFGELPGPVFVKGFLRCSARALRLDPQAVMELYFEHERAALRARRRDPVVPVQASRTAAFHPTLARLLELLPAPRIALWVAVAVLIALIVGVAFMLAASRGGTVVQG